MALLFATYFLIQQTARVTNIFHQNYILVSQSGFFVRFLLICYYL
jgi:hypothetical protein